MMLDMFTYSRRHAEVLGGLIAIVCVYCAVLLWSLLLTCWTTAHLIPQCLTGIWKLLLLRQGRLTGLNCDYNEAIYIQYYTSLHALSPYFSHFLPSYARSSPLWDLHRLNVTHVNRESETFRYSRQPAERNSRSALARHKVTWSLLNEQLNSQQVA